MTDRTSKELTSLRSLVRSAPGTPGRVEAFEELVRRDPPQLNRTLRTLALNPTLDRPMRLQALAAIGLDSKANSLATLREVVDDDDSVVAQRAIERLGKLGEPSDLETIKSIRTGNRTTQRVLRTAKCFLSYRHGLGAYRLDVPGRVLAAEGEKAARLGTGSLSKTLRERIDLAGVRVPGLDLVADEAVRIQCPTKTYVFMPNEEHVGTEVTALTERQGTLGVLVTENLETGTYDPAFYLMTDPATADSFHVFGVRSSGRVALYGKGVVADETVSFSLKSTQAPVVPPVTVEATYALDSRRVRFQEALVETQFSETQQRLRKQPKRD